MYGIRLFGKGVVKCTGNDRLHQLDSNATTPCVLEQSCNFLRIFENYKNLTLKQPQVKRYYLLRF